MRVAGFDWDDGNSAKCQKHGVTRAEIESLFLGAHQVAPDSAHSEAELRQLAIGRTETGRPLFVVFTLRRRGDMVLIRPISARYMHAREIERYEQNRS